MNRQTKTGIATGLIFSLSMGIAVLSTSDYSADQNTFNTTLAPLDKDKGLPATLPLLNDDLPLPMPLQSSTLGISIHAPLNIDDILEPKPWLLSETSTVGEVPEYLQSLDFQMIELSDAMATEIVVGDRVSLPLGDDQRVEVEITSDAIQANGDYTWEGNIKDAQNGMDYPVVVTQGKHGTYGSIATPQGTFTLTTISGQGILYQNPEIEGLREVDFKIPDFFG